MRPASAVRVVLGVPVPRVGMLGAVMVVILSTRYGSGWPIMGGMLLTLVDSWALLYSDVKWIWVVANLITGVTGNFVIAYLLGMCARFDQTGQTAVWGGFASKMGLASGPMLGYFILGDDHDGVLVAMALGLLALATVASRFPAWLLDHGADAPQRAGMPALAD